MASFQTISDVEAWAQQHGGLEAVNDALAARRSATTRNDSDAIRYVSAKS